MPASNQQSLIDIITAARQVIVFAENVDPAALAQDAMRLSAILYQVTIIGEATKRLTCLPPRGQATGLTSAT